MEPRYFYLTTPIYYVNDRPHIGHAYTSVACDVLARFKRLDGYTVKFLTGTDEHGQKVEKSAQKAGETPQALADANSAHFRALAKLLNLSNDDFVRTTEPRHIHAAQALWEKMQANGAIYLDAYRGWYAVRDEAYYQEAELIDGKAPTGAEVEWVEEPSYFFRLSAFQEKLLKHYDTNNCFIAPSSRMNEVRRFVEGGLKDLSISRTTFSWGIPVPHENDDALSLRCMSAGKHIMYVWLDALANYLSALGFPDNTPEYNHFWPASLHMVGKDIVRFHAVYWPAFLMAAGLPLPERIFAHGWWTVEGEKISKSLGNAIPAEELVSTFGLDPVRWFLLREVPFGNDGNFAREAVINRINSELSNTIGNLVQRTLSMIAKHCGGKVPLPEAGWEKELAGNYTIEPVRAAFNEQRFNDAAHHIVLLSEQANQYVDFQAPWKLKKENPARMETVLYVLAERIRIIALFLQAFMPESSSKILEQLAVPADQRSFAHLSARSALPPGMALPPPQPVFPRFSAEPDGGTA